MQEKQVDQWIETHKQETIAALQGAVRIPSVLDEPAPGAPFGTEIRRALDYFLDAGRRLGFAATDVDGRVGVIE